ncbi:MULTISPECIES: hypothetical protein [unclassified Campylobacter]|uniref:hypothetical protein n=1 Tax=unclassified Campylobacter TaxID=2593542 RepID=UPI003D32E927
MTTQREITGVYIRLVSPIKFVISAINDKNELIGECESIPVYKLSLVKNFIDKTNKKHKELAYMASKGLFDEE